MVTSNSDKYDPQRFPRRMFQFSPFDEHLNRYFRIVEDGVAVNTHFALFQWLQGEIQHYVPHAIMLAIWFQGAEDDLGHDVVSAIPGIRTGSLHSEDLLALQKRLYGCWLERGKAPFRLNLGDASYPADIFTSPCAFGEAMGHMQSLLVHGISDIRGGQDCLYVIFSSTVSLGNVPLAALENLLPYLDIALRRIIPHQPHGKIPALVCGKPFRSSCFGLTVREVEILRWVRIGKANVDIASILEIGLSTVKNHLQSVFKKLGVRNRTQAIAKLGSTPRRRKSRSNVSRDAV